MKYNIQHGADQPEIAERQSRVRAILWSEPEVAKVLEAASLNQETADLGDLLDAIIRALELPRTLKELDISPDLIPALSERALHGMWSGEGGLLCSVLTCTSH